MKDVSADYIVREVSSQRKPVELYHIFSSDESVNWYLTSGDVEVVFDENTYLPATLDRSAVQYNSQLEVTTMSIQAGHITDFVVDYISVNPVEILWVSVMKLFRDQDPLEASVVFVGQIKDVSFKGIAANINCVGFEHFLKMPVPTMRYQLTCNLKLYDDKCKKVQADYKTTTTVTLDATKTILTSVDFALEPDGYFNGGTVVFGADTRTIVSHTGSNITIVYKMKELEDSNSVDAYPGCDRRIETCRDNYDNIINFMGTSFIPIDNPALRT